MIFFFEDFVGERFEDEHDHDEGGENDDDGGAKSVSEHSVLRLPSARNRSNKAIYDVESLIITCSIFVT